MKRIRLALFICVFALRLFAQEENDDKLSVSISWTPQVFWLIDGDFDFGAFPIDFESLIYYKPFDRLSFATGLGYLRTSLSGPGVKASSSIDNSMSYDWVINTYRIPVQIDYHLSALPEKNDSYLKAVFTNSIMVDKTIQYENDVLISKHSELRYLPSIGLGIGSFLRTDRTIGIQVEGVAETYLRRDLLGKMYVFRLKLGILFN
jgi:hypothetical protein